MNQEFSKYRDFKDFYETNGLSPEEALDILKKRLAEMEKQKA